MTDLSPWHRWLAISISLVLGTAALPGIADQAANQASNQAFGQGAGSELGSQTLAHQPATTNSSGSSSWHDNEEAGNKALAAGNYREGVRSFELALKQALKSGAPEFRVGSLCGELGDAYKKSGRYKESELLYKRSLGILERNYGADHEQVAQCLDGMGTLYAMQGQYRQAEPLLKRCLAIREKKLGADDLDVAAALSDLGSLYGREARYGEAEALLKRSLGIREKKLGADDPDVADSLNNLAALYGFLARYAEVEPLLKRSLSIKEDKLGPLHPDVALALNNLGLFYDQQGRYSQSEPLYKRSVDITEKRLGEDAPGVALTLNNLAQSYNVQARYTEAEAALNRSRKILEKKFAADSTDLAETLTRLAELYQALGRYKEAAALFQRLLVEREHLLGPDHPDVAKSLLDLGEFYDALGQYAQAEPLYKRSLAIRESTLGVNHPDVAECLSDLAGLKVALGRYGEAEPLYKRSIAIYELKLGRDHPDLASVLSNLAALYQAQSRYLEAELLYKRILAIKEKRLAPDHPNVAQSLQDLAVLYVKQARFQDAEPLYKRAIIILEKKLGPDHAVVADCLSNLADLYTAQARYSEAEPVLKRSLAIREKVFGAEHPIVALSFNNLAGLYYKQGHYPEAERLWQQALAIREKKLGPAHPDVAQSKNNLAGMYEVEGRYAEAEELYKSALAIQVKALGAEHRDVALSLLNLATLYCDQVRYPEAEPLYKRMLAIYEKVLGPDHPDVAKSLNNLADLYKRQGRYKEAEPVYKRALANFEKALGPDHPDVALVLTNLGELYQTQGRNSEAEPVFKRSLEINERKLGADPANVALSLNNLAYSYDVQRRFSEAEPLFKRSLTIFESAHAKEPDHPVIAIALANLAEVYMLQGRYAEAEPLFKRSKLSTETRLGKQRVYDPFAQAAERQRFQIMPLLTLLSRGSPPSRSAGKQPMDSHADPVSPEDCNRLELDVLEKLSADQNAAVMKDFQNILAVRTKVLGDKDPQTAETFLQIGIAFRTMGGNSKEHVLKANEALTAFARTLLSDTVNGATAVSSEFSSASAIERLGGKERARSFLAVTLLCLGNMLADNADVTKAKEAFKLSEQALLAKNSMDARELVGNSLALSDCWLNLGDYSKSAELIFESTRIASASTNSSLLYKCMVADAKLELAQADFTEALRKGTNALQLGQKNVASGKLNELSLVDCYKVLAQSSTALGQFAQAKGYAEVALALKGLLQSERAECLVLLGGALTELKLYDQAIAKLQEVDELCSSKETDVQDSSCASSGTIGGFAHVKLGKYQDARYQFGWALSHDESNLSSDGLLAMARDYNGLALVESALVAAHDKDADNGERARRYALAGSECINKYIKTAFPGLSIPQQCAFLDRAKQQRDALLSVCQDKDSIGPAYMYIMQWKGLLLESLRYKGAIKAAVSKHPELAKLQEELDAKIRLLSGLANKHSGDTTSGAGESNQDRFRRETAERARLEHELANKAGVTLDDPVASIGADTFRNLLKPDEAFVDIVSYRPFTQDEERYAAIAMKPGPDGEPAFFDLGTKKEIEENVGKWRFSATGNRSELERGVGLVGEQRNSGQLSAKEFADLSKKLSDLIITNDKIQACLGRGITKIWLCPEGEFGRVPWNAVAIVNGAGNQIIRQVDSPREFAFLRGQPSQAALALKKADGGTFGRSASEPGTSGRGDPMLLCGLSDFGKDVPALPGALKEISGIKTLADQLQRNVDYLPQEKATKESVKKMLTLVSSAHLATHGFAAGGATGNGGGGGTRAASFTSNSSGGIPLGARNPLSECGLYLALPPDAQTTTTSDEAPNVLTADEIIGLDLGKCDIITLSACQTGLGRSLNGQGVIGLRSAILGAGAKAVLMSLWNVPDEATQELMKRFYMNLWEKKMHKQDALTDAQNYIRSQPKWKDPVNWAAWVLVGE